MRLCSGPGCGRKVPDDVRFCDECKPIAQIREHIKQREHSTGYDAVLDALRKSTRWQAVRAKVIRRNPMCVRCNRRLSEIVDHIVPALVAVVQAQDSGLFPLDRYAGGYFLLSNLQGLCRRCHYDKTLEDKTHVGEWPNVVDAARRAAKKTYSF